MAMTETRTFQNYIDGEWVDAASGETFVSTSPADGELIGTFPRSGADERAADAMHDRLVPGGLVSIQDTGDDGAEQSSHKPGPEGNDERGHGTSQ